MMKVYENTRYGLGWKMKVYENARDIMGGLGWNMQLYES